QLIGQQLKNAMDTVQLLYNRIFDADRWAGSQKTIWDRFKIVTTDWWNTTGKPVATDIGQKLARWIADAFVAVFWDMVDPSGKFRDFMSRRIGGGPRRAPGGAPSGVLPGSSAVHETPGGSAADVPSAGDAAGGDTTTDGGGGGGGINFGDIAKWGVGALLVRKFVPFGL